ncbi:MAG: DUF1223 domain-containing protein [Caulobacteraceae bacterium]|nr:DUF1223 domain-containing protein [Caulobacteraceae bacterium]
MKLSVPILIALWLAMAVGTPAVARRPVVVELFTAQGCASCAKADALAARLATRSDVVVLTWSVDYWDYLGWKDTFADPAFAERQHAFAGRLGPRDVYTPQIVVDGLGQAAGDKPEAVDALVRKARRVSGPEPDIRFQQHGRIAIGSGGRRRERAEVWLVRYDPRDQMTEIKTGDNRGAQVSERNVVRQLSRLGSWVGHPIVFRKTGVADDGLASVVLVQSARGGPILGAAIKP